MKNLFRSASAIAAMCLWSCGEAGDTVRLRLTITSPIPYSNTPLDPTIDFPEFIRTAAVTGVLDPNSIEVRHTATDEIIPHAITEDFSYSDKGRVEFVVSDPNQREFNIRFRTVDQRPALQPQTLTPQIGVGDLLRFNASRRRPVSVPYSPGLHDVNGDGRLDLTGTWNYAYRPGWPWDGIVCYPRTNGDGFEFGDLSRLRYVTNDSNEPQFFTHIYMASDFTDFNKDGKLDLVMTRSGTKSAEFYLNTGQQDLNGLPQFEKAASVNVNDWQACRIVDLDGDGAFDLVVDGEYLRNANPDGWPFRPAASVRLDAGRKPCFIDIDQDGRLDAVCLHGSDTVQPDFYRIAWKKNLGGSPPAFSEHGLLNEIDLPEVSLVSVWSDGDKSGLIVQHDAFQQLSFYELLVDNVPKLQQPADEQQSVSPALAVDTEKTGNDTSGRRFRRIGRAESISAVLSCSDQAWPCLCDWDDDGDQDLLIGGGYGWPRIVINDGTRKRPAFREPALILSEGMPIRFVRNKILGEPNSSHDMGYPYPDFVDWDGDGLRDLVCPNETNRIFWYRNIGSPKVPEFGPRQLIECDDFPDSPALRSLSASRASNPRSNNGVYPLEKEQPFMWRTGAALADFNGDGLMDLVTHSGDRRVATLFVQYRHNDQTRHLRVSQELQLEDGTLINDAIVNRRSHWTESFRAVDWDADGLQDLVYSVAGSRNGTKDGGSMYLLRNVGTKTVPRFAEPVTMRCFGDAISITSHGPHPWPGDFDGDGKPDLITCVEWSVYPFYSHAALMMKERPSYKLELIK